MSATPGPWHIIPNPEWGGAKYRVDKDPLASWGSFGGVCYADEANARLIAAAPDLLEACKQALYMLGDIYDECGGRCDDEECPARICRVALQLAGVEP